MEFLAKDNKSYIDVSTGVYTLQFLRQHALVRCPLLPTPCDAHGRQVIRGDGCYVDCSASTSDSHAAPGACLFLNGPKG